MAKDVQAVRAAGGMTSRDAAKALGISTTHLFRLQSLCGDLPRFGGRAIRVFRPSDIERLRAWREARSRGDVPPLVAPKKAAVEQLRATGGMTSTDAARDLGIGVAALLKLEGEVYPKLPRFGPYSIRVFRQEDLDKVRAWILSQAPATDATGVGQDQPATVWNRVSHLLRRRDHRALRACGAMTSGQAARALGVTKYRLLSLEGIAYPRLSRLGRLAMRAFTAGDLAAVREWLARATGAALRANSNSVQATLDHGTTATHRIGPKRSLRQVSLPPARRRTR